MLGMLRPYIGKPAPFPCVQDVALPGRRRRGLARLVFHRDFGILLAANVLPFSVAQVGLLYYAVPLYLEAQKLGTADTGRVLMIYGLTVIYAGPAIGRLVDASSSKKLFIGFGGILGGSGLALLCIDQSVTVIMAAVFLLGLAGSLGGPAQSSYALGLRHVQESGPGLAMGVQRAVDKLGQMLGPLVVGALFAAMGLPQGLAVTGLAYLAATLLFLGVARSGDRKPADKPEQLATQAAE
jgi:predicted MFS family arabinose efflux permease